MATAKEQFTKIATPATLYTREVGFVVTVDSEERWIGTATQPIQGTTYGNSPFTTKPNLTDFTSYICTKIEGGRDKWLFYFSKTKTDAEANTAFFTKQDMGNHYWPPILLDVALEKSKMQRAANVGDYIYRGYSYTATPIWIPSADTGSLFLMREFLYPEEIELPQHHTLQTRSVSFPVPGQGMFSFPDNLGPEITIDGLQDSDSAYNNSTSAVTSNVGFTSPYNFKATDPETWAPYILYDRQSKISTGAYHRIQMEVVPPNLPPKQLGGR